MKTKMKKALFFFLPLFFSGFIYSQDVPYVPTPYEVVEGMLDLAKVTKDDVVYDLGCGDGRIVVTAAQKFGARGVGVDSNPQRIKESNENAATNNVTDKVEFREQNLFETDLSQASVVTLYLLSQVNIRLRPKLFQELKPGTRVVSNSFDMDDWTPEEQKDVSGRNLYLWIIPVNTSGRWEGKVSGNNSEEKYILELNQQFQKVSGNLQIGSQTFPISEAGLKGENLQFKVKRKEGNKDVNLRFEGILNGNQLQGKFSSYNGENLSNNQWVAERDPNTMKPLDPAFQKTQSVENE